MPKTKYKVIKYAKQVNKEDTERSSYISKVTERSLRISHSNTIFWFHKLTLVILGRLRNILAYESQLFLFWRWPLNTT